LAIATYCTAVATAIVARPSGGGKKRSETRLRKPETERYERAAKCAMEIALMVKDDLMRDAAPSLQRTFTIYLLPIFPAHRGSMAGLRTPLPTLRRRPCRRLRTARGR
jgi:hypothetical protein